MALSLVVGLGNPGAKYENTRHNIGFMVLDKLGEKLNIGWKTGFNGKYALVVEGNLRFYLLKPMTYMNLSGGSVSSLCRYFDIDYKDMVVVHDELDFPFGKLRYKSGGSAGGHNGVSSIIEHAGTDDFIRLRMGVAGISRTEMRGYTADYVLAPFTKAEQADLSDFIDTGSDSLIYYAKNGLEKTMQIYHKL